MRRLADPDEFHHALELLDCGMLNVRKTTTLFAIAPMALLSLLLSGAVCPDNSMAAYVRTATGEIAQPVVVIENVCAWPNLTMLGEGTIAAAIFNQPNHGTSEGDVDVWTSGDQGNTWQLAGTPAPHDPNSNRMNHSAGPASNGDLLVIASGWSNDPPSGFRSGILDPWLSRSSDNGQTWTIDKTAVPNTSPRGYPVVPYGDIVEGSDGSLRVAVYDWPGYTRTERAYVLSSHDSGSTWGDFVPLDTDNVRNETALMNLGGERWMAVARSGTSTIDMYSYSSSDNGATWQPQGQITGGYQHPEHLMRMQDGKILLTYGNRNANPVKGVEVIFSENEGATWSIPMRVMDFIGPDGGYPSSVQLPDGQILTSYYAQSISGYSSYHMGVVTWDQAKSLSELNAMPWHIGSKNPLSEGFLLNDADATSAWNDVPSTPSAGRLTEIGDSVAHYATLVSAATFDNPQGWTATTIMKLNSNSSPDDFHTYQIVYDPAADAGNGGVTFYVDGVNVGTQTRAAAANAGNSRIVFGDNASLDFPASDSEWALVRLDVGQNAMGLLPGAANFDGMVDKADAATASVPEPDSHGLLLAGLASLGVVRFTRCR